MEPLAALNGMPSYFGAPPVPNSSSATDRDASAALAAGKSRPVKLSPDRVEASEAPVEDREPRPQDATDESTDVMRIGVPGEDASLEDSKPASSESEDVDLSGAGATARNLGVTYQLHPDLPSSIQSQVIDRDTAETIRSIPSEERLDLAARYQKYMVAPVGTQVDALA